MLDKFNAPDNYIAVESSIGCSRYCDFHDTSCEGLKCKATDRDDNTDVIFKMSYIDLKEIKTRETRLISLIKLSRSISEKRLKEINQLKSLLNK